MAALDKVKELRAEATEENQVEKIWEALEVVAAQADRSGSDAVRKQQQAIRSALI